MNPVDKIYVERSNSRRLTLWQLISHYAPVLFILLVPIFTTYSLIQIYITHSYTGVRSVEELISGYIFIVPALLLYVIQKRRLKFKEIKISVNPENFKEAAVFTGNQLNWEFQNLTNDYAVAVRNGGLIGGSWGEWITIIRKKDVVLINSICNPDNIISVASWGWNKKNAETFKISLERISNVE